jgi:hypothetical protein
MGAIGLILGLFTVGYMLGVWTAGLVFRQRQGAYEDVVPTAPASARVIVLGIPAPRPGRLR